MAGLRWPSERLQLDEAPPCFQGGCSPSAVSIRHLWGDLQDLPLTFCSFLTPVLNDSSFSCGCSLVPEPSRW